MPNKVGERIKVQRESLGLSQGELAKRCGWPTASRLGNYELGNRKISAEDAVVLADVLKVSPSFLLFGDHVPVIYQEYVYPVFSAHQLTRNDLNQLFSDKPARTLESTIKASEQAFWYEVTGHSMTASLGIRPSFPEGMMILCEPDREAVSGSYCLVKLISENEIVFKKFLRDDGKSWLEPLNVATRYQPMQLDESVQIIATVISAVWPQSLFV